MEEDKVRKTKSAKNSKDITKLVLVIVILLIATIAFTSIVINVKKRNAKNKQITYSDDAMKNLLNDVKKLNNVELDLIITEKDKPEIHFKKYILDGNRKIVSYNDNNQERDEKVVQKISEGKTILYNDNLKEGTSFPLVSTEKNKKTYNYLESEINLDEILEEGIDEIKQVSDDTVEVHIGQWIIDYNVKTKLITSIYDTEKEEKLTFNNISLGKLKPEDFVIDKSIKINEGK